MQDILDGSFKGFAILRHHMLLAERNLQGLEQMPQYHKGYGFLPPSQAFTVCECRFDPLQSALQENQGHKPVRTTNGKPLR